jgi:hypothetical protein
MFYTSRQLDLELIYSLHISIHRTAIYFTNDGCRGANTDASAVHESLSQIKEL